MRSLRTCTLLLLLALFGGCSNTFLYNQLDWLIPWYIDDYVDLTREQRREFKSQLRELLAWHRSEELASYIVILDSIEADLQQPVTAQQVEQWANRGLAAYERIEERMLPIMFEVARGLSDAQMAAFIESLERDQRELEEKYLQRSDQEYFEESQESLEEALSDVLGRLTAEQKAVLAVAAASLQRFDAAWLSEREQWYTTLSNLLQREPGWEQAIMEALDERDRNRTENYRSAYNHNAVIINQTIADILNMRTERQSKRLLGEIEGYRSDLRKLIAQAEP